MQKSSILVGDELRWERYYLGNFQGADYHLGLKTLHGFCCKMPMQRSEYVINSVDPDELKHHRLLVAFEHCLNVTALQNRCNTVFKMETSSRIIPDRLKAFPGTVHLVQLPILS